MRVLLASALLLLLAAWVVPVSHAHGEALAHVNPKTATIPAQSSMQYAIEFEEGDLRKDWVFVMNAFAQNGTGPLEFQLWDEQGLVSSWTLPADNITHHLTTRIRDTFAHGLVVQNNGPDAVETTFFYDASCNCAGKPVPPDVPKAAVLFQVDPQKGDHMRTVIPEPSLLNLTVDHAIRVNAASRWPEDFRILSSSATPTTLDGVEAHVFEWTASGADRHFFWVTAVDTDRERFNALEPDLAVFGVYIQPSNTRTGGESPFPVALGFVALALAIAARRARS